MGHRRWKIGLAAIGAAAVVLAAAAGWAYRELDPARHFDRDDIAILSTGDWDSSAAPPDPLQDGGEPASDPSDQVLPSEDAGSIQSESSSQAFQVLLLGVDSREGRGGRTDVMIVAQVVPSKRKVNLLSIPRDTRVWIPEVGYTKINHAYVVGQSKSGQENGGIRESVDAVSRLLRLPIHYYALTDFSGFETLIDEIGGVTVEMEEDVYLHHAGGLVLPKGQSHIDGKLALSLVRERYSFAAGDFARQTQQTRVLKTVAKELLRPSHVPELAKLLIQSRKWVETNFTDKDLLSLALMFKGLEDSDIRTAQIPGRSAYANDPLIGQSLYYWVADEQKLKALTAGLFGR